MDEEELQQPQKKIDIDSFFNRVDAVEGVASNALKQSNLNANAIQANKTLINSISVSIEAMRTEIRDIANYIVIENKFEKDKRDDEKFEAEDKEQKESLADRLKAAAQGAIQPKDIKPGAEKDKGGKKTGGGFLGGLFKIVAGLGLAAGFIALAPFMAKALIIGAGGMLLTYIISKIAPPIINFIKDLGTKISKFLDKVFKPIEKIPIVGKVLASALKGGVVGGLPGFFVGMAKGLGDRLKGGSGGGGGDGAPAPTGGGEIESDGKTENNIKSESNMSLEDKSVEDSSENILDSVDAEEDGKEKKKFKVTRGKKDRSLPELEKEYADLLAKIKKMKEDGRNEEKIDFQQDKADAIKFVIDKKKSEIEPVTEEDKRLSESLKKFGMGEGESSVSATREFEFLEPIENETGESDLSLNQPTGNSFNNNNNVKNGRMQLDSQVSSAEIKGTGTTIRAVRMTSNQFLSTHDKNIPIEVLRAIA